MDRRTFLGTATTLTFAGLGSSQPRKVTPPVVDFNAFLAYGKVSGDTLERLQRYPILILETGSYPEAIPASAISPSLSERYAYFAIAVNSQNPTLNELRAKLSENKLFLIDADGKPLEDPQGPGSHMVDMRDKRARLYMLQDAVQKLNLKGYTGLFVDALDSAIALESKDPAHKGLVRGTIQFFNDLKVELSKPANAKVRPGQTTKYVPRLMINGGWASFAGDAGFDPLKELIPACRGNLLIESQLLDDKGVPRENPLDFSIARAKVAAGAASKTRCNLHIVFVEPGAKDPKLDPKGFLADYRSCSELAGRICREAAESTSGCHVTASVCLVHKSYTAVESSLELSASLAFPPKKKK